MKIQISNETKKRLAMSKYALPNKLLELEQVEKRDRKELTETELMQLFDNVWQNHIQQPLEKSLPCDEATAKERLGVKQIEYLRPDQEKREFYLQHKLLNFIAQLKPLDKEEYELTQLWLITSSDSNPKGLYIEFEDTSKKEDFKNVAESLGYADSSKLALKLIRDFIETVTLEKAA